MNIFYFDKSFKECAKQHCDRHVVKMIIEYAQLLSTAHRVLDGNESIQLSKGGRKQKVWEHPNKGYNENLYKATHINHPSAKWVRHSRQNYTWLFSLWTNLCREYTYRYGKEHATYKKLFDFLINPPRNIATNDFSPPWRAMPEQYKMAKDREDYCEQSYRAYFNGEKQKLAKWTNRENPSWFAKSS